jgi:hypothetical protein
VLPSATQTFSMRHQFVLRALLLGVSLLAIRNVNAQTVASVRINEIIADNSSYSVGGVTVDMVELFNTTGVAVDLGGCSLSDSNTFPRRYVFPAGSVITNYYRLFFSSSLGSNATTVPFGISASGGFLHFYNQAQTIIDQVEYGLQPQDFSLGRVADGTGPWTLCIPTFTGPNIAAALGSRRMLKVNEWGVKGGGKDFIEIFNPTNKPVPIFDMFLSDSTNNLVKYRFPINSYIGIGPMGGFLKMNAAGGSPPRYPADEMGFSLDDSERAVLSDTNATATLISAIIDDSGNYGLQTSDISQGRLPDGGSTIVFFPKINDYETRSPGDPNFLIFTNLYVNELLAHTDPPLEDAVEFQNLSASPVNISGWWLSNQRSNRKKYLIPNGPILNNGGFRVIYEGLNFSQGFNSFSTNAVQPFTFNSAQGDQVILAQTDGAGKLTGYIAYEDFEASANGVSFGHYNTSLANDYKFVAMSQRSFGVDDPNFVTEFRQGTGKTNPYPKIGPIVINEIHFFPSNTTYLNTNGLLTMGANPAEEFIELRNIDSVSVPLYDPLYPTNHWKLQKGVEFTFPLTNLAPFQICLVVSFNPYTDTAALNNFRSRFGVSNDVPIFGPWIGSLDNSGESVELYRPDPVQLFPHPDAGFVPYIRIDKVNYDSSKLFPVVDASNNGKSLQRKNSNLFGNDYINWAADFTTAGRPNSSALQDSDGDGIPDQWEMDHGFNKFSAADADDDPDNDGVNNLGEYVSGSNPTNHNSVLRVVQILPYQVTNAAVRFPAFANTTYTVQSRNSLAVGSDWSRVENVPSAAFDRVVEVVDTNAWKKADRYYRVVAPATQ